MKIRPLSIRTKLILSFLVVIIFAGLLTLGFGSRLIKNTIIDQFYRVDRKEGQKTKGTGLGLSIAKKIIDAHRRTILVESEFGKGSVFSVVLPKVS